MSGRPKALSMRRTGRLARCLAIVARDQVALYPSLQRAFGRRDEIAVLFDRRHADRRREAQPKTGGRRHGERRCLPHTVNDSRARRYVLVRPHD